MAGPTHVTIGDIWIDVSIREAHSVSAEVTEHPVEQGSDVADHIRLLPRTLTIEGLVTNHPIKVPQSHLSGAREDPMSIPLEVAPNELPRVPPTAGQIEGEPSAGLLGLVPGVGQGVALLGALRLEVRPRRQFAAEQVHVNPRARTTLAATALHFTDPFDRVADVHAALLETVEGRKLVTIVTGLVTYNSVALTDLHIDRDGPSAKDALRFTVSARVLRIVSSQTVTLPDPVEPRGLPTRSRGKQATSPATPAEEAELERTRSILAGALGL